MNELKEFLGETRHPVLVWGVCADLARRTGADAWLVRAIAAVLVLLFSAPVLAVYIVLGFLLPGTRDRALRTAGQILHWMDQIFTLIGRKFRGESSARQRGV